MSIEPVLVIPVWGMVIIGILVAIGALGGLYFLGRVVVQVSTMSATLAKVAPALSKLNKLDALDDLAEFGSVLFAIAKEFKNDSGSSLKDTVDELAKARKIDADAAEILKGKVSDIRAEQVMLALQDRRQPAVSMTNISGKVEAANDFVNRDVNVAVTPTQKVDLAPGEKVEVKGVEPKKDEEK